MELKCIICEKIISGDKRRKKFCSKQCYYKLQKYIYPKKELTRFSIFKRDKFRCIYCGKSSIEDKVKLEVDHLIPQNITQLSIDKTFNKDKTLLVTACEECNGSKSYNELSIDIIERIQNIISKR